MRCGWEPREKCAAGEFSDSAAMRHGAAPHVAGSGANPRSEKPESILRSARADVLVPEQDPSRHALHVFEPSLTEHLRHLERPRAALAVDDHLLVLMPRKLRGRLCPGVAGEEAVLLHDVGDLPLVRLTD